MNIETQKRRRKKTYHTIPFKDDDRLRSLAKTFPDTCRGQRAMATLIADDVVWELPYTPAIGHPAQLPGREEVVRHVTWFVGAVENFRFYDLKVHAFTDPEAAVAEVRARGTYQTDGAYVSPGLRAVPARGRRQDRVPARIFRSCACS